MNKAKLRKPTPGKFSLLRQLCNLIPPHLVPKLARDTGVEARTRAFTPLSHVVSLLYSLSDEVGSSDDRGTLDSNSMFSDAGKRTLPKDKRIVLIDKMISEKEKVVSENDQIISPGKKALSMTKEGVCLYTMTNNETTLRDMPIQFEALPPPKFASTPLTGI